MHTANLDGGRVDLVSLFVLRNASLANRLVRPGSACGREIIVDSGMNFNTRKVDDSTLPWWLAT